MLKYIKNPDNAWVGLAAPQVWVNKRIIVVSLIKDREDENFSTIIMINPEILEHSEEKELDKEGCLSVPQERWLVKRWKEIKLQYIDEKWQQKKLVLKGLSARVVQHEIDHLDGILFTDKLESKYERFF
jgi:peptide deformylase